MYSATVLKYQKHRLAFPCFLLCLMVCCISTKTIKWRQNWQVAANHWHWWLFFVVVFLFPLLAEMCSRNVLVKKLLIHLKSAATKRCLSRLQCPAGDGVQELGNTCSQEYHWLQMRHITVQQHTCFTPKIHFFFFNYFHIWQWFCVYCVLFALHWTQ